MLVWVVSSVALAPLFARHVLTTGAVTPPVAGRASGHQRPGSSCVCRTQGRPVGHVGRQARDLHDRPDVDGAQACPWNLCGGADRLVDILGVDQELAAELFARLRERPVGDERFTVAHPDADRRRRRV